MRAALRRKFLRALHSDAEATSDPATAVWTTRCRHCRTRLQAADGGTPAPGTSLEHVVPSAWFGRRAAAALVRAVGEDPDDARSLALACTRCSHDKGKGPDARGPGDPRALEVIETLLATRAARWRQAP